MKLALPLALTAAVLLALSFNAADAIVSGSSSAGLVYREYPYNLLVPFFTIACSTLLVALVLHYYRMQWGRRFVLTE
jgi:hypothetical protein